MTPKEKQELKESLERLTEALASPDPADTMWAAWNTLLEIPGVLGACIEAIPDTWKYDPDRFYERPMPKDYFYGWLLEELEKVQYELPLED